MRKAFLLILFMLLLCFGGCGNKPRLDTVRVVTAIELTATREGRLHTRTFTDSEKMHDILQYLRKLDPYTPTDIAPDSFRTDAYQITVFYSDGGQEVYRQIYDRYFQIPDGSWRLIDPGLGDLLFRLLEDGQETACIF